MEDNHNIFLNVRWSNIYQMEDGIIFFLLED